MARMERYVAVVGLIVLLVIVGSLSAFPQTYKALTRVRSEEQEAEANNGYDVDKDQKPPEGPPALEDTTQGLALAPRSDEGDKSNKKNYHVGAVYRDEYGALHPVFQQNPPSLVTAPPNEQVVSPADSIVIVELKASTSNNIRADAADMIGDQLGEGYPEDYPFDTIRNILRAKQNIYEEVLEKEVHTEELVTRIDSPSDPYLCSSKQKAEYPVYHETADAFIVNVKDFYQSVTYERCEHKANATCANVQPAKGYKVYCEQVYGEYEVFTVPRNNPQKFVKTKLKFPSCCKCRHVAAP